MKAVVMALQLINIGLWVAGMVFVFKDSPALALFVWSWPAGYAAGTGFAVLLEEMMG